MTLKIALTWIHQHRNTDLYMIMDVAHHITDSCPACIIDECELKKLRKFLHLNFDNKGIDAVNINNILKQ
jgi:hypothetical protein